MRLLNVALGAALLFGVMLDSGCAKKGPVANELKGKVTYKGSPVTGGTLSLHSKDNVRFDVTIQGDGTFRRTNPPLGEMTVTIETDSIKGRDGGAGTDPTGKMKMMKMEPPAGATMGVQMKYVPIPPKYADRKTSPLKWTVTADSMNKDFDLVD